MQETSDLSGDDRGSPATALQVGVFPADCRGQLIHHVRHRGARSWAENGRREDPRPLAGPGVCTLAHAVDEADEFLFALRRSTDDDQQAQDRESLRIVMASLCTMQRE